MDQMKNLAFLRGIVQFWGNLTGTQRFITIVFIVSSIVVLSLISMLATKPQMAVLFSGLQSEDSGTVVTKLQEKKIPYQIDGNTIKVPEKNVAELRMALASEGLPKSGTVGFELFDKTSLGMTEFTQRLNYQRALQGELSRTINELDGVENSRVHIVIPDHSVFLENDKQPSASVVVKLRPGSTLNSEQVSGVVHLVSTAVEGLKPNSITIVDTNGNELSGPSDESGSGLDPRMGASQMALKRAHERQMERDIQSMLERVLGANKAVVRVNARINFDRVEQTSETYQPLRTNQGVLSSETRLRESYAGQDKNPAGVMQPTGTVPTPAAKGGYSREETTSKYEVSKNSQHVVKAPGQIERLTVAVMVDGDVDSAKKAAITNAVTMAAGIDMGRGDQIKVESMKFDDTVAKANDAEMQAISKRESYGNIGKIVGAVLLLLLVLFFAKGSFARIALPGQTGVIVHEISGGTAAASLPGLDMAAHGDKRTTVGVSAGGNGEGQAFGEHLDFSTAGQTLQAAPEEIAQVLRKWMSEDRS